MRRLPALITVAALAGTLAACSTGPTGVDGSGVGSCDPTVTAGDASTAIDATGELGTAPEVSFPTPLVTDGREASTVVAGDGDVLETGDLAELQLSLYLGSTGQLLGTTDYADATLQRIVSDDDEFTRALECVAVGSRVVSTATIADVYGEGALDPTLGIADDDTLVMVIDVAGGLPGRATGSPRPGENGMPAVVLAPDGRPGISVPNAEAPTEERVATLREGDGDEIEVGDQIVLQATTVTWNTGNVTASTWESGTPYSVTVTADGALLGSGTAVPGIGGALVGAPIGSQLLIVLPTEAGDATVTVVDVLGTP